MESIVRGLLFVDSTWGCGPQHCAALNWCLNEQKELPRLYIWSELMVAVGSAVIFDIHSSAWEE